MPKTPSFTKKRGKRGGGRVWSSSEPRYLDTRVRRGIGRGGTYTQYDVWRLDWTVLYCNTLYCTVMYCVVLYCTVLYSTVLYTSKRGGMNWEIHPWAQGMYWKILPKPEGLHKVKDISIGLVSPTAVSFLLTRACNWIYHHKCANVNLCSNVRPYYVGCQCKLCSNVRIDSQKL